MENVISLNDKRSRSYTQNYHALKLQARDRFSKLSHFKGQTYESDVWFYRGERLFFSTPIGRRKNEDRMVWPTEVTETVKFFIIGHLWDTRLRKTPLSATRIIHLRDFMPTLIEKGMSQLNDLTFDLYYSAYQALIERYKKPESAIQNLNAFVHYLKNEYLLISNIDTISPHKNPDVKAKSGPPAHIDKMPIPELVRAVIQLKWKVEEAYQHSPDDRTVSDLLCVYTQSFQYGLGLRLGEVLRLPVDCLKEINGELFCLVWTEKGMIPHARYVPKLWRDVLIEVVTGIQDMTRIYRTHAVQLETNRSVTAVRDRLDQFKSERRNNAEELIADLRVFLKAKTEEATLAWVLQQTIDPEREYDLIELREILPIFSTSSTSAMMYRAYESWGLEIISTPLTRGRNNHKRSVLGSSILEFVAMHVRQRATNVTQSELTTIIQGRETVRDISRDRVFIDSSNTAIGGSAACYTFSPDAYKGKGRAPEVISIDDAIAILTQYGHGSYDIERRIDLLAFRTFFPEIALMQTNDGRDFQSRNPELNISEKHKLTVKVAKEDSSLRYSVNEGYTISNESIDDYIYKRFIEKNYAIENELHDADIEEESEQFQQDQANEGFETKALVIQSKSFEISQKVSEYLFLRAEVSTGATTPNPLVPEILGYSAVQYFFTGNDRYENAFAKYNVDIPAHAAETWQSHKGRHWRTTSLFRAGTAEAIVNKWMGRTELQGRHYDHNTGSERAKTVGKLMLEDQNRFVGDIPQKIRQFTHDEIPLEDITDYLNAELQTIQYTPLGYCVRSLNLNPCELNMKCLVGADGKGCKHFIFDLKDDIQRERLVAERDKTESELSRLIEVYESGVIAAKMHIDRHLTVYRNANKTLEHADKLLGTSFVDSKYEIMPFHKDGSYPDDCPFQCGAEN